MGGSLVPEDAAGHATRARPAHRGSRLGHRAQPRRDRCGLHPLRASGRRGTAHRLGDRPDPRRRARRGTPRSAPGHDGRHRALGHRPSPRHHPPDPLPRSGRRTAGRVRRVPPGPHGAGRSVGIHPGRTRRAVRRGGTCDDGVPGILPILAVGDALADRARRTSAARAGGSHDPIGSAPGRARGRGPSSRGVRRDVRPGTCTSPTPTPSSTPLAGSAR